LEADRLARLPASIGAGAHGRVARTQSRRALGRDSAAMDVRSVCSRRLVTADRLLPLAEGARLMRETGVRRLLVRSEQGLLSFDDVLQACAAQFTGLAAVLPRARQREALRRKPVAVPRPALPVALPPLGNGGWMQGWTAPLHAEEQGGASGGALP
jgi:CBS domain-containing protein